jgi:hypothetical protein
MSLLKLGQSRSGMSHKASSATSSTLLKLLFLYSCSTDFLVVSFQETRSFICRHASRQLMICFEMLSPS